MITNEMWGIARNIFLCYPTLDTIYIDKDKFGGWWWCKTVNTVEVTRKQVEEHFNTSATVTIDKDCPPNIKKALVDMLNIISGASFDPEHKSEEIELSGDNMTATSNSGQPILTAKEWLLKTYPTDECFTHPPVYQCMTEYAEYVMKIKNVE